MNAFRLLMLPANRVCDALNMTDENERSVVRMLVNTLLWTTLFAAGWFVVWMMVA